MGLLLELVSLPTLVLDKRGRLTLAFEVCVILPASDQ